MRPMEKEKGKREAGKGEHEGNEDSEDKEKMEASENHRARGRSRTRRKKSEKKVRTSVGRQSSHGTCDNWRKRGEDNKRKKKRKCGMCLERSSVLRSGAETSRERQKKIADERGDECEVARVELLE